MLLKTLGLPKIGIMEILEWHVQLRSIVLLEWLTCQRYGKPVCVLTTKTCIKTSLSKPVYHLVIAFSIVLHIGTLHFIVL